MDYFLRLYVAGKIFMSDYTKDMNAAHKSRISLMRRKVPLIRCKKMLLLGVLYKLTKKY